MKTIKFFLYFLVMSMTLTLVTSCDPVEELPPIGGYNNADEVGSASLLAYWPLNGDAKESKTGTAPSKAVGANFDETGIKGKGVKLTSGFLKFPTIANLQNTLTSFTVSAWIKVKNNKVGDVGTASVVFSLTRPNEWAGNINLMCETGWGPATNDSIVFKGLIVSDNAIGWQDSRNTTKLDAGMIKDNTDNPTGIQHAAFPNKVGGTWAQIVMTWDGTTRQFKIYSNGKKISNPKWEQRGTPDGTQLKFFTPTTPIIGALGDVETTTETWNKPFTGSVDEVRIFNKALSDADINSLYELEKAGR